MKRFGVKFLAMALVTVIFAAAIFSCGENEGDERKSRVFYEYFDTVTTLYDFSGGTQEAFSANAHAFIEEISICHKLFDIYHSYEGLINIKTLNENAGNGPLKVDARIIEMLTLAKDAYEKTDGAVNVAMGAVLKIWHECRDDARKKPPVLRVPTDEELRLAAEHCDINKLIIDEKEGTVELLDPEMSLDVGAVAKGFAIDRSAQLLRQRGAVSYAIDVGGNLYAIGAKADGTPFKTGVENPNGGEYLAYIDVSDGAVATSGDYERGYTVDGKNYHHIINGKTLYPEYYYRSVSVYSDSAAKSDALSTALFNVASYDEAREIINAVGGVREVIFIEPDGKVQKIKP